MPIIVMIEHFKIMTVWKNVQMMKVIDIVCDGDCSEICLRMKKIVMIDEKAYTNHVWQKMEHEYIDIIFNGEISMDLL